ncbi:LPD11 domain-containing protein [Anaerotignum sp.]|uniref:LPD11 domain-containing protein n=1 Tax=Anaerotignum sp. TaxID=2039241 RepID=UPI0028AA65CD|nr:LPD11 domain-containing protein [Anaerotignum sp.]
MGTANKESILVLQYIGEDYWSRPVYKDQFEKLWKDVELGESSRPCLHSSVGNEFEGEPDFPIKNKFIIQPVSLPSREKKFQYMMLDRLKSDCNYYLGYGNRQVNRLWAKNEREHIEMMKSLWISFADDEKPEWLTWTQILQYEKEMCVDSS